MRTILVILIIFSLGYKNIIAEENKEMTDISEEDIEVIQNLEILEELEMLENIQVLEDYETIKDMQVLESEGEIDEENNN